MGAAPYSRSSALGLTPGNIYGLLGVNGAGKSTLLKLMSGLLFPAAGSVRSLGQNPAERQPSFLLDVFVLAEDAQAPNMLARDYLRARAPFYPRFDHALFDRYLREFELPQAGNLATLSHGQQKKFLLAFGLATQAKLVLLDEPTNGLDIPSKSLLRRVIAEAVTAERLFVISTHQVRDLGTLMDPIVILHQGRVLLNRTLAEIGAQLHMTQQASPPRGRCAGSLVQRAGRRRLLVGLARRRRRAARPRGAVQRDRRQAGARAIGVRSQREVPRERPALVATLRLGAAQRRDAQLPLGARRLGHGRARRAARLAARRATTATSGQGPRSIASSSSSRCSPGARSPRACASATCTAAATNMAFLLLPASALEKTLSRLLLHTVGLVVYLLVFTTVLSWVLEGINTLWFGVRREFFSPFDRARVDVAAALSSCTQALFFLGAAWFRKVQFVKTVGVAIAHRARLVRHRRCSSVGCCSAPMRLSTTPMATRSARSSGCPTRRRSPTSTCCRPFAGSWRGCA